MRASAIAFGLLTASLLPASLVAKWPTDKITIKAAGLTNPIEITDPDVEGFGFGRGRDVS